MGGGLALLFGGASLLFHRNDIIQMKMTIVDGLLGAALFIGLAMGKNPLKSVVSVDLEAHDIPGLYVVDGSVIPTSPAVNPQMTIMALATRAADELAKKL